jgi:hypothetical protein
VSHLELERENVLKKIEKIKALIKRALEYNDLILDTNSLIYLFKKDFLFLVLSLLLSLIVIISRISLNNK